MWNGGRTAKNPLVPFVEELRLRMRRLDILRGRGRKVGVGEHRAFWKPGRATGVLKYSHGFTQIGNWKGNILAIVTEELVKRHVPAILGDGDGFAIVRHLSAHGLGRRCHFRYVADDKCSSISSSRVADPSAGKAP